MNQMYAEAGVKRKDTLLTITLRILLIIGILLGIIIMMIGKSYFTFIGIAIAAVMVFLFPRLSVDYEYVFVDGQIDFDQISGKSKRKTLMRIDMDQVEVVAQKGSPSLDGYAHENLEYKDFTSGRNNKPYIIIVRSDNKKYRVAFEPTEKMLSLMKQKSPRKVEQSQ